MRCECGRDMSTTNGQGHTGNYSCGMKKYEKGVSTEDYHRCKQYQMNSGQRLAYCTHASV
jgi:hypothetical protein